MRRLAHRPACACLALFGSALLAGTVTAQAPVTFNGVLQSHTFKELNLSRPATIACTIDCRSAPNPAARTGICSTRTAPARCC